MNKYKIAILTEQISTHSGARVAIELATRLIPLNKSVSVYAYKRNLDQETLRILKKHKVKTNTFNKPTFLGRFLPSLKLLTKLRQERPDFIIFCGTLPFFFSAKLAGIKIIRIYMGTQFDAYLEKKLPNEPKNQQDIILNSLINTYIRLNELITVKLSTRVIAISKYTGLELKRFYKKKADRIIYLGGNHLLKVKTRKDADTKTLKLLAISRITPYKGFHILIEEINKLKNVSLTIVGTVEKKNYFKYLKTISKPNIIFKNETTDKEISKLYSNSDVYITADHNLFFGFPIAEAAFFGIPSIAFLHAAAGELIENKKTGYLVKNKSELNSAINKYLKNPKLIENQGKLAKIKAENNFNWSKIATEYQSSLNFFNKSK